MKQCNFCLKDKKNDSFNKDKNTKDGFSNRCRSCQKNIRDKKQKRTGRVNINSFDQANFWLLSNFPQYEIVKWGGASSRVSVFFDKKRNIEFEYTFSRFKDKIKKYPNRVFSPSKVEIKEKIRKVFKEKYGTECALQVDKFKRKVRETNVEKYGFDNPMKSEKFKKEKGIVKLVEGKTIQEWSENLGVSYSHFRNVMSYQGLDVAKNLKNNKTNLESKIELILKDSDINFEYNTWFPEIKIRPDFLIKDKNIIIECNGDRWHSDEFIKNKNFHQKRLSKIESVGFIGLFFNTNEILNKTAIVESIIKNKLNLSQRIFARKCQIELVDNKIAKNFFEKNHLMGNGSGRVYSLVFKGDVVMAIRVKWLNKNEKLLDISRVCSRLGFNVIGGFSKLIKHVLDGEKPKQLQTFVDRRYGSGKYLSQFGFKKKSEHISFAWTNGKETFHRMKFPKNEGYEKGLFKLWDCGQAKYVLSL